MFTLTIAFFIAVATQIAFFIAFLVAFSRKPEIRNGSMPVSVIVSAHDEEENLRELIPLLLEQDYPEFEVIIVNDRSNDGTFDFMLEETKTDSRLKSVLVARVPDHVNGKKFALTLGIKAAHHEIVLLTDADCRPTNNQWIKSIASGFDDQTTFVLGYSPYIFKPGFLNTFIRFESLLTAIQYIGFALLKNPYMGVGRNLAYRKSFFLEKKGFNNLLHITGGDDDLFVNQYANKRNTVVVAGESALTQSLPKTTWKTFIKQKVRHLSVGKHYKAKHRFLLGMFTLSWLLSWAIGLLLISLYIPENMTYYISGALFLRCVLLIITTQSASKYLGQKFEAWPVLILDFLYSIYYISTGLVALLTKKVQWKN